MKSTTTVRRVVLTIIGVFVTLAMAAGGIGIQLAASKTTLAAPTITSQPANPTSVTSASFSFTGPKGAIFQCQLDSTPTFTICTSPKSYLAPLLAEGSHAFQVKALAGSDVSAVASYTWTVDITPPSAPTITRKPAALSTTTSPSFSFGDSESGVTFRCQLDGSAYAACTSPRSYSNLTQGSHTFSVQAVDAAGNISIAKPSSTWSWTINSAGPSLSSYPPDPTQETTNSFTWSEAGVTFQCEIENGAWGPCSSPFIYTIGTTNNQQHQFGVRAVDTAGNVSAGTFYHFKYVKAVTSAKQPFTITGSVTGLSIGVSKPITVTITNPNNVTIFVSALNVAVSTNSASGGCASNNFELQQSNISSSLTVAVPANSSVVLPAQGAVAPQILLTDSPTVNQDVCKGKSFTLTYSGTATN